MKLTIDSLKTKYKDKEISNIVSADFSNSEVRHVDSLKECEKLHKLNLSKNGLKKSDALSGLRKVSTLTWLNLSQNELQDCAVFNSKFEKLLVLNLSHNKLESINENIKGLKSLNALILNNNHLKSDSLKFLKGLDNLNTLVLSHNPEIDTLDTLPPLPNLVKISCTNCSVTSFPMDLSIKFPKLKELRLSGNKITSIPLRAFKVLNVSENITTVPLQILELGNNLIEEFEDISPLKFIASSLFHLSLKGTELSKRYDPVTDDNNENEYKKTIIDLLPTIRVLDGVRFDPKFIERRKKRQDLEIKLKEIEEKKKNHEAKVKRLELKAKNDKKIAHIKTLESKLEILDKDVRKIVKKARNTGAIVKKVKEKPFLTKRNRIENKSSVASNKEPHSKKVKGDRNGNAKEKEVAKKIETKVDATSQPSSSDDFFFSPKQNSGSNISIVQENNDLTKAQRQRQRQKLKKSSSKE